MFYKFTSDKWQNTAAKAHLHGDYVTAHRKWEASAKQGAASAQYNLGVMYETGQGVSQDYKAAEKWYKMAAEQGFANAQYELAEILYVKIDKQADPINIRSSLKEMLKWYRAAAEQGNKDAKRGIKRTRKSFMKKAINQCLYDEVDKVTGPESKEIVENYCEQKFSLKTLDWLVANHFR